MPADQQRDGGTTSGAQGARAYPPRMTRSQPQLATAYAPGAVFTWEGGKGACLSVPIDGAAIDFSARQTRRDQIIESLQEFCQNWLARGLAINRDAPVYETQLLDTCFHNPMRQGHASVDIALDRFEFLRPERMGYLPGPLVYRCDTCELVREYVSPAHQLAEPLPTRCAGDAVCPAHDSRWRQLDVVYAHWSGGIEGLSPFRYTLDRGGTIQKIPRCQCGSENFRLAKQGNQFSRWRFICTGCGAQKEVYQTDPFSLNLLKPRIDQGVPHQWSEINMIPVSYRASPVFYVQTARFIVFDSDPEVITLMGPTREDELVARVGALHGFAGADPSDERIKQQLEKNGQGPLFAGYQMFRTQEATARAAGDAANIEAWAQAARLTLRGWYDAGLVFREVTASPALQARVRERGGYARRYDPIRSTVEHDALRRRKVNLAGEAADLKVAQPELCPEYENVNLRGAYERRVTDDLARAGIAEARLIRNLDMVEFSFGFTRIASSPETVQKDRRMPVRLMGFPPLPSNKRPIYVIEQQNEAIYIQLDARIVAAFLQTNGVLPEPPPPPRTIGGALIESYRDFGLFLKDFSVRDQASRVRGRDIASMTYLLLHSVAHHVMHGIARFSGLDLGSLSEVIFPADLAFVVHRRGMTEDLGNISSMWRDQNAAFLRYLVARRELRCGSGTLCDHRGGACPACIMIPETSCIAGNQLLSRAALVGGRAPLWDTDQTPLRGYFEIVQDLRNAGQPPATG
jgi:hypothetical protein